MKLNIVLVAPEIPQNTGAIGRLCVCLDATLHLVKPLGFSLASSYLRRAGLDYWQYLDYFVYENWEEFLDNRQVATMLFASTRGSLPYFDHKFKSGDYIIFGNETSGFPQEFYKNYEANLCTIPMPGSHARSHNLANAAAIVAYEAYRQISKIH